VAYGLSGGEAADNFTAGGRAKLEVLGPDNGHSAIYLLGNLSRLKADPATDDERKAAQVKLQELQQSEQGIHIAVVPHRMWGSATDASRTVWLSVGWKLNALKDIADSLIYINAGRLSAGFEITGLRGQGAHLPVSLSIEPTITLFDKKKYMRVFGEEKSNLKSLETTLIIPAGAGRGILFESTMTVDAKPVFRAGLLFTSSADTAELGKF
jgi:hypothetical protein